MNQLSLFESGRNTELDEHDQGAHVYDAEGLLALFRSVRISEGAHERSIAREVSQLRSITRESQTIGGPSDLPEIFSDLGLLTTVLCEPSIPIARSTGMARLIAAQRFIRVISAIFGRDADRELVQLDALLPATRSTNWHSTGTLVGGTRNRRRRRSPTLDTQDLHRILHAATHDAGRGARRDQALVALHCFSGLRPEEIVALTWQQLHIIGRGEEGDALSISVVRKDKQHDLPLPRQAAQPLAELAASHEESIEKLAGTIFRPYPASTRPLSYRTARDILRRACEHAGLPPIEAVDLRAAYAHWLRARGLSDHEVAAVLGLERVRSVDRLLKRHRALDAQRQVREMFDD